MNPRETLFASIRKSLGVTGQEPARRSAVAERLASHPRGVIPARGQLPAKERLDLFVRMVEGAAGSVARLADLADVPLEVSAFLRRHNLPMTAQRGADPLLAALPWERAGTLGVSPMGARAQQGHDGLTAVSHALGAVAETGTLVMASGADNPTSLNFLPDNHIVVLEASAVAGDYETVWQRLREKFGDGVMPRAVNLITGPSRSADIEQTLLLGAHGPRRLHVILVGEAGEP